MEDFIKNQIKNRSLAFDEKLFLNLSPTENSMVIIELPFADYSLTDIARLVENNNARVMSLFVLPIADGNTLLLSIKLDVSDVTPVLMSFERFSYKIVYYKMREGEMTDLHKARLDELLYYIEM